MDKWDKEWYKWRDNHTLMLRKAGFSAKDIDREFKQIIKILYSCTPYDPRKEKKEDLENE